MRLSVACFTLITGSPSVVHGKTLIRNLKGGRKEHDSWDGSYWVNEGSGDYSFAEADEDPEPEPEPCPTSTTPMVTLEPPLPGVMPGATKPKLILAQDVDYPPYAQLGPAADDFPVTGFGPAFAEGMAEVCDLDVTVVQTQWSNCWDNERIGQGLALGQFHACTTYTHSAGVRNRYLEFSRPILNDNKAAGILTRLNEDGTPVVSGDSDLSGVKVVDVVGFAPTADNLAVVTNPCTGDSFSGYEIVTPSETTDFPNDDALRALLDGEGDAMWVYADQVERLQCANNDQPTAWDCSLWDGLGTDFAYVQVGMFDWARAGTSMTIAKKGAGVADMVNPCIEAFLATESYYNICEEWGLTSLCFQNEFFPADVGEETFTYDIPTNELTTDCSSGYCSCP